jgi:hypothetical protein
MTRAGAGEGLSPEASSSARSRPDRLHTGRAAPAHGHPHEPACTTGDEGRDVGEDHRQSQAAGARQIFRRPDRVELGLVLAEAFEVVEAVTVAEDEGARALPEGGEAGSVSSSRSNRPCASCSRRGAGEQASSDEQAQSPSSHAVENHSRSAALLGRMTKPRSSTRPSRRARGRTHPESLQPELEGSRRGPCGCGDCSPKISASSTVVRRAARRLPGWAASLGCATSHPHEPTGGLSSGGGGLSASSRRRPGSHHPAWGA